MSAAEHVDSYEPEDGGEWRAWLADHHAEASAVWLIYRKKGSGRTNLSWGEAVDHALCFGWIDSRVRRIDEHRYRQYFSPRRPTSVWSKVNKEKVARLIAAGSMQPAGLAAIEAAQANGSWTSIDGAEDGVIPADLGEALAALPDGLRRFRSLPRSEQRNRLQTIATTRSPAARRRRVAAAAADLPA